MDRSEILGLVGLFSKAVKDIGPGFLSWLMSSAHCSLLDAVESVASFITITFRCAVWDGISDWKKHWDLFKCWRRVWASWMI